MSPNRPSRAITAAALVLLASTLHAQQTPAGGSWANVKALPAKTKLHVTTDHGGRSCTVFAVSDDTLTCASGGKAGNVLQRTEIQHIKLNHRLRSTLVGTGLGAGLGGAVGYGIGKANTCSGNSCFNIIGPGAVAVVFGVGSALIGSIVGGTTDFTRGSSIYTRP